MVGEDTSPSLQRFAVRQENVNSEGVVSFLDAFVWKLFDVRQRVESAAEVRLPCLGIGFVCARLVSP